MIEIVGDSQGFNAMEYSDWLIEMVKKLGKFPQEFTSTPRSQSTVRLEEQGKVEGRRNDTLKDRRVRVR